MKKRKAEVAEIQITNDVNQNILNIITPAGLDFDNISANISENIGKIFCISKYSENVEYGWLSSLCNLEGTSAVVEYRYTTPDRIQKVIDKRISDLKADKETKKEESEKQKIDVAIADLKKMITRIVKGEPVGYVNIMLHVQATNANVYESRIKRVKTAVSIAGSNMRILKFRQAEALTAISPYGRPNPTKVSNIGERNMPISTLIGGFPMANAGINDINGYYLGKTKNNRIVRVNQWLRDKDRINSNWFISGVPGVGKSSAAKTIILKEYALGTKTIILDAEREFIDMANNPLIKGQVIDCSGSDKGRINILQVRKTPRVTSEDLLPSESINDYMEFDDTEYGSSDLALYIQQLRVVFQQYFNTPEFDFRLNALLEKCLITVYKEFGITWDTDVANMKSEEFPIISDLYDYIVKKMNKEQDSYYRDLYRELEALLYSAAKGADSKLWNGHTTLASDANLIICDVSGLLELDENVKRAQFYNITMWAWQQMSQNRNEKIMLVEDEGYLYMEPENINLIKFQRNLSKRGRKYEAGFMFITHSVGDVLDPAVKRFGQAILDNSCYKLIMGTDGKNLEETKEIFNLTEREESLLSAKERGKGIFFAGSVRIELAIDIRTEFLEIMGKAGGR
jgi:Predicted ATPase